MNKLTLLSASKAANLLGVNRRTLYRWRQEERGPRPLRVGKRFYYMREALEQWMRALSLAS